MPTKSSPYVLVLLLQDTRQILQILRLRIFFFLKKPILFLYSISIGRRQDTIIAKKRGGPLINCCTCGEYRWKPGVQSTGSHAGLQQVTHLSPNWASEPLWRTSLRKHVPDPVLMNGLLWPHLDVTLAITIANAVNVYFRKSERKGIEVKLGGGGSQKLQIPTLFCPCDSAWFSCYCFSFLMPPTQLCKVTLRIYLDKDRSAEMDF